MKRWTMVGLLAWATAAAAQGVAGGDELPARIAAERERLQRERAAIEEVHQARQRDCWQRFAVNECLREVRRSRHAALDPLRQQELQLNAQERAWRVQQHEDRLHDKSGQERLP